MQSNATAGQKGFMCLLLAHPNGLTVRDCLSLMNEPYSSRRQVQRWTQWLVSRRRVTVERARGSPRAKLYKLVPPLMWSATQIKV